MSSRNYLSRGTKIPGFWTTTHQLYRCWFFYSPLSSCILKCSRSRKVERCLFNRIQRYFGEAIRRNINSRVNMEAIDTPCIGDLLQTCFHVENGTAFIFESSDIIPKQFSYGGWVFPPGSVWGTVSPGYASFYLLSSGCKEKYDIHWGQLEYGRFYTVVFNFSPFYTGLVSTRSLKHGCSICVIDDNSTLEVKHIVDQYPKCKPIMQILKWPQFVLTLYFWWTFTQMKIFQNIASKTGMSFMEQLCKNKFCGKVKINLWYNLSL